MARAKRTDSGIYIGVIGAGRTDGIEKERSRRENLDIIRQLCLLTIVLFDPNGVVQPYQPQPISTDNCTISRAVAIHSLSLYGL